MIVFELESKVIFGILGNHCAPNDRLTRKQASKTTITTMVYFFFSFLNKIFFKAHVGSSEVLTWLRNQKESFITQDSKLL